MEPKLGNLFWSYVFQSGNIPDKTKVLSYYVLGRHLWVQVEILFIHQVKGYSKAFLLNMYLSPQNPRKNGK